MKTTTRGARGAVSGPTADRALAAPRSSVIDAAAQGSAVALSGAAAEGDGSPAPLAHDPANPMAYVDRALAEAFGMTHLPNVTIVEPDGTHTPPAPAPR